ncbi:MAG TPA: T9SS type A sorting domain-containing protein [Bacteroidia bacterium]|nr:T9SS type A sorting domain-containing protein [Bacteroidia bacterium]
MKKTLLIGAAIAVGFSAFAQNNRQAANLNNKTLNKSLNVVDTDVFPTSGTRKMNGFGSHKSSAVCTPLRWSSAPNCLTIGGGVTTYKQGCLTYNKDLNTYLWTHRRSASWAVTAPMGSGSIQSDWINATTLAKDSTIIYYDQPATQPGRYPTGAIYNPAGNVNIANAFVAATGPCLIGNSAFTGLWYNTRQLTGTAADQTLPALDTKYTASPSVPFGSTIFLNVDMQQVGTKIWVGGEAADTTKSTATDHNATRGAIIGKCDFTGAPTWSHDSIIPGYKYDGGVGRLGYSSDINGSSRIAFFGQTGYIVEYGRLATNYNNSADSMLAPIVYKSTNGGTTWTRVLDGYDWRCKHPELMKNVGTLLATKPKHFTLNFKHGIDVTVDANGKLHLVATMVNMLQDGHYTDSAGVYSLTYTHSYKAGSRPIIWDLMTDGTDWKTMEVDSINTSYVGGTPSADTTAAANPISVAGGGTFYPYGARVQVSRSTDGTKLFYSWADSDPSVTGTLYNSQPDLYQKAYDVTSNKLSISSNITNGVGTCFFHILADVAYFDGTKHHAPMVYTLPRTVLSAGVYDGNSISDHYYVDCAGYGAADYAIPAIWNPENTTYCMIGIQSHNNFFNSVNAYPNPSFGTTNIVVNLNESKAININVFDAIGNVVYTKRVNGNVGENTIVFDGTSLTAGVYYYTVTAGYEKVTKKLVIQK